MQSDSILLKNARLADGSAADVLIRGGLVAEVRRGGEPRGKAEGASVIDLAGQLLLPSLVDGHTHLDKTLWGMPWRPHAAGDARSSRIDTEIEERRTLPPVEERAEALLRAMIAKGTTATRSHVDIDPHVGLDGLHAILALRERFRDLIDIQIVAFPQSGIMRLQGMAGLLDQAMADGADLIGGIDPEAYDGDLDGHLDAVFGLAEKHGKGVDIHLHTTGEVGAREFAAIVERAKAHGAKDAVTVSHGFCLGEFDGATLEGYAKTMAADGISVATSAAGYTPMAPVKRLREAGVQVFAGSDNARDRWGPYGSGCMLERAMLVGWKQNFRRDADLEIAFDLSGPVGRAQMGLPAAGPEVGMAADLIALPAENVPEAIIMQQPRTMVMKAGKVVIRQEPATQPPLLVEPHP